MKILSKYVHLLEIDRKHYLFNVANGFTVALNSRLVSLIDSYRDNIDSIKGVHPDLYDGLVNCGMLVDECLDETTELIARFEAEDDDPKTFDLTINPTLDCNLRCWYCYETHGRGTMMTPEVIESIKRLIDNKLSNSVLKRLNIGFFGGEPLIGWDKVVIPLLQYGSERCAERGVKFSSDFTTNGVLLTENRLEELYNITLGTSSFQISIDGNRSLHDNSRVNAAKHPTYDKIMANVAHAAAKGFKVILRFNYTPETLDAFTDVLSDLEELPSESRKNIACSFHQVWQTTNGSHDHPIKNRADKIADFFRASGFTTAIDRTYYRSVCYGDRSNHVVVNYNGDLYKCTAREFLPATREGVLSHDGKLKWNSRFTKRMAIRYAGNACRNCSIMPVCNSGCSQKKLECHSSDVCPKGMDNNSRHNYLLMTLRHRLYK